MLKAAIRNPLIYIEIPPGKFDALRKVRKEVRLATEEILDVKKALENLGLTECYQFCSLS
jgi:hypothetical protein